MDYSSILYIIIILLLFIVLCYSLKKIAERFSALFTNKPFNYIELAYASENEPFNKPFVLQKILTPEKCNQIIAYSKDKLFESEVVGGKHLNIRNSSQTWISKNNSLVKPLFMHMSDLFGMPFENAEDLQVVRYLPGQYYNEHHDACCDNNDKCLDFIKKGGQRMLTILLYLNDGFEEGYTQFKNINLKIKPALGDAIVFFPLADKTSRCHPFALHAGMPVTKGEKWVANIWYRQRIFQT